MVYIPLGVNGATYMYPVVSFSQTPEFPDGEITLILTPPIAIGLAFMLSLFNTCINAVSPSYPFTIA